jgi:hypothetical protein
MQEEGINVSKAISRLEENHCDNNWGIDRRNAKKSFTRRIRFLLKPLKREVGRENFVAVDDTNSQFRFVTTRYNR